MEIVQACICSGGGSEGEGKRLHPCCSIIMGMILIVVAPFVIWNTEGDYVKTLKALDAAGKEAKQPCPYNTDGSCDKCNLGSLTGGDLVFLACKFSNMRTLKDLQQDETFIVKELRPAVSGSDEAIGFRWHAEMFQWKQTRGENDKLTMDFDIGDCTSAATYDDENDPDQSKRRGACCQPGQVGYTKFQRQNYGKSKTCKPYQGAPPVPTQEGQLESEILDLPSMEAVVQAPPVSVVADDLVDEDDEEEDVEDFEDSDHEDDAVGERVIARRMRGSSIRFDSSDGRRRSGDDRRRRTTAFTCSFPCYDWQMGWYSDSQPDPKAWSEIPTAISEVGYLSSPAGNLPFPFKASKSWLTDDSEGINMGGITLGSFKPVLDEAATYVDTSPTQAKGTGLQDLKIGPSKKEEWIKGVLNYTTYTRDWDWTANEANAVKNCLVSKKGGTYSVGDLRICFEKSPLGSISVIAEVKKVNGGMALVVSEKHLRADTKLRDEDQGYRWRKDKIISLDDLLKEENKKNEALLYAGRIVGPLILWLAFYCFLQPILWVMEKFGDCLDAIPCVGGCMGLLADFVETIMGILICIVSCCLGIGCGLFAMAIAWLYYKPMVGIPLLIVALLFFGAVAFYAYSTRDPNKAGRRRSSARQPTVGSAVELNAQTVQPAAQPVAAVAAPMAQAVAMPQPTLFQVMCPEGVVEGSQILVTTPDGRQVSVQVPAGVSPGQMFQVQA